MKNYILFSLLLFSTILFSQNETIGLLENTDEVNEGYVLFSPDRNNTSYLINNCGEVVNSWTFSEIPGRTEYILEDGNILYAGKDSLELRDWDNNIIWSANTTADFGLDQHHDIEPLPNGNILLIAYDSTTMFATGINPNFSAPDFRLDKIVEIEPTGTTGGNLIWEWKLFDHLVQSIDPNKPNYGVINSHPELLDINLGDSLQSNYVHVNAIDYNPSLDQIIFSARNRNEIFIIDHSTTTAEAASHSGGNAGKGGDFLWRWGNPQNYDTNFTDLDRQIGGQHDCEWVTEGPHLGKISLFSNTSIQNSNMSEVMVIAPERINNQYLMSNNQYTPLLKDWSWSGQILGTDMHSTVKSGVQMLENGNALIAEATKGRISEIDSQGNTLWVYMSPDGSTSLNQFDNPTENSVFRATRYPLNYSGFIGKDLTPTGIIENNNTFSDACIAEQLSLDENYLNTILISPNPTKDKIEIITTEKIENIMVVNYAGKIVLESSNKNINLTNLSNGLYLIYIKTANGLSAHKIIKQ